MTSTIWRAAGMVAVLALPGVTPAASAQTQSGVVSEGPATQMATAQYVLHSARVGRDFVIKVTSPVAPAPAGEKRPVVYALDGGYEVAGPIGWILGGAAGMRQAYVVSVGYRPTDYRWRDVDLAFRPYDDAGRRIDSGAAAFRAFLDDELRPFIAHRLPVDDRQAVLLGHSEGALFAANILADAPDEYAGYVIASPSVWSDPSIVDRLRAGLGKARKVRIFLAVGRAETPRMLEGERAIAAVFATADPSVAVRARTYEGATHLSYYPELVAQSLAWLLPVASSRHSPEAAGGAP